ncbi:hypothetical protein ZZ1p0082 [Acinetobacter phage ZZ1]|jgi:hypothetical protein|uniref:Uncharacterized protein n=1 Tax=Acinetobacter phage ZZ1 TaxID=1049283 RepID=I3WVK8_9CAUD|nr:hypothetical protein ZZ1p0082 [Acinetobacter phage ZZ1]AFL47528.1 hypothetical protein ZZ1p0082 [Acinetobacter phage ZZ1]
MPKKHVGASILERDLQNQLEEIKIKSSRRKVVLIKEILAHIQEQAQLIEDMIYEDDHLRTHNGDLAELDFEVTDEYGRKTITWYASND